MYELRSYFCFDLYLILVYYYGVITTAGYRILKFTFYIIIEIVILQITIKVTNKNNKI